MAAFQHCRVRAEAPLSSAACRCGHRGRLWTSVSHQRLVLCPHRGHGGHQAMGHGDGFRCSSGCANRFPHRWVCEATPGCLQQLLQQLWDFEGTGTFSGKEKPKKGKMLLSFLHSFKTRLGNGRGKREHPYLQGCFSLALGLSAALSGCLLTSRDHKSPVIPFTRTHPRSPTDTAPTRPGQTQPDNVHRSCRAQTTAMRCRGEAFNPIATPPSAYFPRARIRTKIALSEK